jgi:hypothetical protein
MTAKIKIFDNGDSRFNCRNEGRNDFITIVIAARGARPEYLKSENFARFVFKLFLRVSARGNLNGIPTYVCTHVHEFVPQVNRKVFMSSYFKIMQLQ